MAIKKSKKSKKIKKRKTSPVIEMYGQAYEKPHYVNWLPEVELLLRDMVKNTDYANLPTKLLKTNKGKYWNSECIYPRTKNEFIHRFFEKKEPFGATFFKKLIRFFNFKSIIFFQKRILLKSRKLNFF